MREWLFPIFFVISAMSLIANLYLYKKPKKEIHDVFYQLAVLMFPAPSQIWFIFPFLPQPRISWPYTALALPAGIILIYAGFYLLLSIRRELGGKGFKEAPTLGCDDAINDTLVKTGIYARSRNPMYLSLFLLFAGYFACTFGIYSISTVPYVLISLLLFVHMEEKGLERKFAHEYEKYRKDVPMFFPRIWER